MALLAWVFSALVLSIPRSSLTALRPTSGTSPLPLHPGRQWVREGHGEDLEDSDGSPPSAPQCWENSVGEEVYKLIIFNFLLTVAFAFLVSLPRR